MDYKRLVKESGKVVFRKHFVTRNGRKSRHYSKKKVEQEVDYILVEISVILFKSKTSTPKLAIVTCHQSTESISNSSLLVGSESGKKVKK